MDKIEKLREKLDSIVWELDEAITMGYTEIALLLQQEWHDTEVELEEAINEKEAST